MPGTSSHIDFFPPQVIIITAQTSLIAFCNLEHSVIWGILFRSEFFICYHCAEDPVLKFLQNKLINLFRLWLCGVRSMNRGKETICPWLTFQLFVILIWYCMFKEVIRIRMLTFVARGHCNRELWQIIDKQKKFVEISRLFILWGSFLLICHVDYYRKHVWDNTKVITGFYILIEALTA